jgi:hypothetical protein
MEEIPLERGREVYGMRITRVAEYGTYVVMLTLGVLLFAGAALGLPCKGETVNTGDTPEQVATKCGEPMLKEKRVVSVRETEGKVTRSTIRTTDVWTFNFGPAELMQSYIFENGKVADIRSVGYGLVQDFSVDNCRNGELLALGDNALDAYNKCGEPLARETRADKVIETEEGEIKRRTTVSVVEWTYRYGPNVPGYTLRFENGLVTDIRTREFGK